MNGLPEAYPNGTHLVVGNFIHFGHGDASLADDVERPPSPSGLPPTARVLLTLAGLSADHYVYEHAKIVDPEPEPSPLEELLSSIAHAFRLDTLPEELRGAWIIYREGLPS